MNRFIFLTMLMLSLICSGLHAQMNYEKSIGMKFGQPNSLSFKLQAVDNMYVEGLLSFSSSKNSYTRISASALAEFNKVIEGTNDNLFWYFGGGAGVNFYSFDDAYTGDIRNISLSLLGVIGLDYAFPNFPINLSVDWMPVILIGDTKPGIVFTSWGLAIRYVIN